MYPEEGGMLPGDWVLGLSRNGCPGIPRNGLPGPGPNFAGDQDQCEDQDDPILKFLQRIYLLA